jgi:putative ABC transport system substrate-binding protein
MGLLKEALPRINRVAILNTRPSWNRSLRRYADAAKESGVLLGPVEVHGPEEFARAFAKIDSLRPEACIVMLDLLSLERAGPIVDFMLDRRLPAMYESEAFVRAGGLMSYGVNRRALWQRAAVYVDKILKGADPAVLPVEPPHFELVLNLATARKLGVTLPAELLLEADEVIK